MWISISLGSFILLRLRLLTTCLLHLATGDVVVIIEKAFLLHSSKWQLYTTVCLICLIGTKLHKQ